jgi:single-strand DNA-binding protein
LQWRSWESPDGQKRSKHEVVAENVQFMPRARDEGMGRASPAEHAGSGDELDMPPPEEDDIPF